MSLCFRKIDVLQGTAEEISKATGNKVENCRPKTIVLNKLNSYHRLLRSAFVVSFDP